MKLLLKFIVYLLIVYFLEYLIYPNGHPPGKVMGVIPFAVPWLMEGILSLRSIKLKSNKLLYYLELSKKYSSQNDFVIEKCRIEILKNENLFLYYYGFTEKPFSIEKSSLETKYYFDSTLFVYNFITKEKKFTKNFDISEYEMQEVITNFFENFKNEVCQYVDIKKITGSTYKKRKLILGNIILFPLSRDEKISYTLGYFKEKITDLIIEAKIHEDEIVTIKYNWDFEKKRLLSKKTKLIKAVNYNSLPDNLDEYVEMDNT